MKKTFGLFLFFGIASSVHAYVPVIVSQESLKDITRISDPTLKQTFYGSLSDFPQTFEIVATEPFYLSTQILVPDIDASSNNVSGIIIKEGHKGGRVEEVSRLSAKDAEWGSAFNSIDGDSYRIGPSFEKELDAGAYRIEVHTPDNVEKYVLVVGTRDDMSIGYFQMVKRLIQVKMFFGKSPVRVVESPYVYIPLLVFGVIGGFVWYRRRKVL
jgi:hypothetical protein